MESQIKKSKKKGSTCVSKVSLIDKEKTNLTKKGRPGRPKVNLTEEEKLKVAELAISLTTEQIADYFGISRATFYRMMDRDPDILRQYKKGGAIAKRTVGNKIYEWIIKDNCKTSAYFYAKTRMGWKETQGLDHTSSNGSVSPSKTLKIKYV